MAIKLSDNIKIQAPKPIDSRYLDVIADPYVDVSAVNTAIPLGERHIGLTVNIGYDEYWYSSGTTDVDLVLKTSSSGSTINGVSNIGTGIGIYSGITPTGTINLRSLVGSGGTDISISGESIIINSNNSGSLNDGILRYDNVEGTFLPYTAFTTGVTFYQDTICPTGTTRLNLNARLGATEFRLSTGHTASGTTHIPGDIYWDNVDSTATLQQTNNVEQRIGQELFVKVKNSGASTIFNGTVVYAIGSVNDRLVVSPARASNIDGDDVGKVFGMVTEDIPANGEGFVTTAGKVRDLNTTGFTEGDIVYLSPTVFGGITAIKPTYPNYTVEVGMVTNVDESDGKILIRIVNATTTQNNIRGIEIQNAGFTASTRSDVISAVGSGIYYLPANPIVGQQITILDQDGDAGDGWEIIIDGNGNPINSNSNDTTPNYQATINTNYGSMTLLFIGGTSPIYGWRIIVSTS